MTAVYPGSFDPATNGHFDIITRAAGLYGRLIVAVLDNGAKMPTFTVSERVSQLRRFIEGMPNVEVVSYSGLLVHYMKSAGAKIVIRGLRALTDFENEFQMALINKSLDSGIETVFLMTSIQYLYLSSSVVKEVAAHNGDIDNMVPAFIRDELYLKLKEQRQTNI